MHTVTEHHRAVVREGYQILLRAETELDLPAEQEKIAGFYRKTADACIGWATEVAGERLRAEYLALPDHREQSRFRPVRYLFFCRQVWENGTHAAWVCESLMQKNGSVPERRRSAQVWDLSEQTILPYSQILHLVRYRPTKEIRPPFRADGVYPHDADLVFFRTSAPDGSIPEFRVSLTEK